MESVQERGERVNIIIISSTSISIIIINIYMIKSIVISINTSIKITTNCSIIMPLSGSSFSLYQSANYFELLGGPPCDSISRKVGN